MTQINDTTTVEFLKLLLNESYKERKSIGEELHGSKVYLTELNRRINDLEKSFENGKIDLSNIEIQKQLIGEFLTELKKIRFKLYPPFLPLSGILIAIKQYTVDHPEIQPGSIDFHYDPEEREYFGQIFDIRIYKSCVETIDFFLSSNPETLLILFKSDGKTFKFEVLCELKKSSAINFDLNNKSDLIKGYVALAEGNILDETNWKDRVKISFKINS